MEKPQWRQEESRHTQNVSKSKQGFHPEVQGQRALGVQEQVSLLQWQLFVTMDNKTGKAFLELEVALCFSRCFVLGTGGGEFLLNQTFLRWDWLLSPW